MHIHFCDFSYKIKYYRLDDVVKCNFAWRCEMGKTNSSFLRKLFFASWSFCWSYFALQQILTSCENLLTRCLSSTAAAKSLQLCPTVCDPIDGSPSGSPVPGILQARTLEWVAISFSNAWKWKVKVKSLSRVLLLATPWTAAYQAPPSMGFSRQQYWSGVPLPSPKNLSNLFNYWYPKQ